MNINIDQLETISDINQFINHKNNKVILYN